MADEIIYGTYINCKGADSHVLVESLHNKKPQGEYYVEELVRTIATQCSCSLIYSNVSRTQTDLNRAPNASSRQAIEEYTDFLRNIVLGSGLVEGDCFLHLSFHGMNDRPGKDMEIGSRHATLASPHMCQWFSKVLLKVFPSFHIEWDKEFEGDESREVYRYGSGGFPGFGNRYNLFQIELSYTLRKYHFDDLINGMRTVISEFEKYSGDTHHGNT